MIFLLKIPLDGVFTLYAPIYCKNCLPYFCGVAKGFWTGFPALPP